MPDTRYTFCRICEATCGLRVDVADNRMRKAKPGSSAGEGAAAH